MRDAGKHAYDSTTEMLKRLEDTFGSDDPNLHAVIASNAMQAAFMHFYVAARLSKQNASANAMAQIWVDTMSDNFDQIERAFNKAIINLTEPQGSA